MRDQFLTILAEVTAARNAESTKVNEENKEKILAAGGKVVKLTDAQRTEWVKAMKPVWAKFEADIGADMIEAAQNAGN